MITSYDHVSASQIKWFNRLVFGDYEFPSHSTMSKIRELDNRLSSEVGWYIVENNEILSQVCYFIYDIKTIDGPKKTGIPLAVATIHHARSKGYATKLMDKVHTRMVDQNCSYSILATSKKWKSYDLYKKLGYVEISTIGLLYGELEPFSNSTWSMRDYEDKDESQLAKLFNKINKKNLGIVERPINFVTLRTLWKDRIINLKILEDDKEMVGYVNLSKFAINEISEFNVIDGYSAIEWLRFMAPGETMIYPSLHQYKFFSNFSELRSNPSDAVLMVKDLEVDSSEEEILTEIGFKQGKFAMYSFDRY